MSVVSLAADDGIAAEGNAENWPVWIGANFWSRGGGLRMWARYDRELVRDELRTLAEHRLNVTRSFCFWPDFVPREGELDERVAAHFLDFLDAHVETGLRTIPTLLVGHMSGQNWDPPWRRNRDLYRNVELVAEQAWFVAEIARRFGGHPVVAAWSLSNEMPLYGGAASEGEIAAWARLLVQAVRSAGATQPISLGDGAWGVEMTGEDNGYSLRALTPLVDFVGPHVYPMQDDQVRQLLTPAFVCALAGGFGKPVVLEELGVSSDFASAENAAAYYRTALYASLLAGARGWIAWCNSDFDEVRDEDPYRHHVFELHFGLTDARGRPKPQLTTLETFARDAHALAAAGCEVIDGDVALVVPEHFERVLPFTDESYRRDIRDHLLQAYVAAREADLAVGLVRERDGIPGDARLLLAPCAKLLTSQGIDRLRAAARGGATVYLSFFAGSTPVQRGPWLSWLDDIFGVRHQLRAGLVEPVLDDIVTFEFVRDLGELAAGTKLDFPVAGTPSARGYLPVEAVGAEVVAVDGSGRPALVRHRVGDGQTVLCTYPLEHMAARTPWVNPENTWRLYSALATLAGVRRPVRVDDPRVLVGLLRGRDRATVILVNLCGDTLTVEPLVAAETGIALGVTELVLGPFAVEVVPCVPGASRRSRDRRTALPRREGRDLSVDLHRS